MGTAKRVLVVTTEDDVQKIAEPSGLTTPVLSDNGTKPVWIEAPTGGVTDHGALTGLADDDHPQYATDTDLSTHAAAADPHTVYQKESEKGAANGYAGLGAGALVPIAQLASGTPDGTKFVRDDGTLVTPSGSGSGPSAIAYSSGDVTVTGSLADITGCSLSLAAGTYIIAATFDVLTNNALNDRLFEGHLDSGGADQTNYGILVTLGRLNDRVPVTQLWRLVLASTTTVKLRAKYSGGTVGDFTVKAQTVIAAWGAAGSVATDAIWDAAGDLAVGSGANTAARLAIGAAGGALSRINGAVAWNSGTSFPTAVAGDRYWRTDLGMEFYYNGTIWLSTTQYAASLNSFGDFTMPIAASRAGGTYIYPQLEALYIETVYIAFYIVNGTALSASHKWAIETHQSISGGTLLGTITIDSGSVNAHRSASGAINAATLSTDLALHVTPIKTGTPGNLYLWARFTYRKIGT